MGWQRLSEGFSLREKSPGEFGELGVALQTRRGGRGKSSRIESPIEKKNIKWRQLLNVRWCLKLPTTNSLLVHCRPGVPLENAVLFFLYSSVKLHSWTSDKHIVLHTFYSRVLFDPLLKILMIELVFLIISNNDAISTSLQVGVDTFWRMKRNTKSPGCITKRMLVIYDILLIWKISPTSKNNPWI